MQGEPGAKPDFLCMAFEVDLQVDRVGRTLAFMRSETFAIDAAGKERLIATGSLTKAVTAA